MRLRLKTKKNRKRETAIGGPEVTRRFTQTINIAIARCIHRVLSEIDKKHDNALQGFQGELASFCRTVYRSAAAMPASVLVGFVVAVSRLIGKFGDAAALAALDSEKGKQSEEVCLSRA